MTAPESRFVDSEEGRGPSSGKRHPEVPKARSSEAASRVHWLSSSVSKRLPDVLLRRIALNSLWLFAATLYAAVLSVASTIVIARGLGPTSFGRFVLVLTVVETIALLVSFQAWQAIIKFGSEALNEARKKDFETLVAFGFSLDLLSAAGGFAIAFGSSFLPYLPNIDATDLHLFRLYCLTLIANIAGTPVGVLRLFRRYDLLAYKTALPPTIKLTGVLICILLGAPIESYLAVYCIAVIAGNFYAVIVTCRILIIRKVHFFRSDALTNITCRFPQLWQYVWTTNFSATVRLASRKADILVIGVFLTSEAVGVLKLAKQIADIPALILDPVYQCIYPELAGLGAERRYTDFSILVRRISSAAGVSASLAFVVFIAFGKQLVDLIAGPEYGGAYYPAIAYLLALVLALWGIPLQPSLLALGRPRTAFACQVASTICYIIALPLLSSVLGTVGAGIAYIVYYAVWLITMTNLVNHALRTHRTDQYTPHQSGLYSTTPGA